MRRTLLLTALLPIALCACTKSVTIDHNISAEFPLQESLGSVSVLFAGSGDADLVIDGSLVSTTLDGVSEQTLSGGESLVRYKSLSIVSGTTADAQALLEETFWKAPELQWIFCLPSADDAFTACGFVHCLRARGLENPGTVLYAGSNVYDKISGLAASPVSFTVKVKEVEL